MAPVTQPTFGGGSLKCRDFIQSAYAAKERSVCGFSIVTKPNSELWSALLCSSSHWSPVPLSYLRDHFSCGLLDFKQYTLVSPKPQDTPLLIKRSFIARACRPWLAIRSKLRNAANQMCSKSEYNVGESCWQ